MQPLFNKHHITQHFCVCLNKWRPRIKPFAQPCRTASTKMVCSIWSARIVLTRPQSKWTTTQHLANVRLKKPVIHKTKYQAIFGIPTTTQKRGQVLTNASCMSSRRYEPHNIIYQTHSHHKANTYPVQHLDTKVTQHTHACTYAEACISQTS